MSDEIAPVIKKGTRDYIGIIFRMANSGDPWDCLRYTGTLITELTTVADTMQDHELQVRCGACSRTWEQAVQIFESSKDDHGNPNWGQPMILCNRVLKMLGPFATRKYGDLPSESGKFIGSQAGNKS